MKAFRFTKSLLIVFSISCITSQINGQLSNIKNIELSRKLYVNYRGYRLSIAYQVYNLLTIS